MDRTQRGVLVGMASAFLAAVAIFVLVVIFAGPGFVSRASLDFRVELLAASVMAPALSLFVCIARLANHRFFTPADINGSALTDGTARAKLLRPFCKHARTSGAGCAGMPELLVRFVPRFLGIIPASGCDVSCRAPCVFAGYANGAPARAFGFAFTFYPTVILGCATVFS
jgi:hypothetical protein